MAVALGQDGRLIMEASHGLAVPLGFFLIILPVLLFCPSLLVALQIIARSGPLCTLTRRARGGSAL